MPTMILQHGGSSGSVRFPLALLSRRLYSFDSSVYNVIKVKALMVDDFSLTTALGSQMRHEWIHGPLSPGTKQ